MEIRAEEGFPSKTMLTASEVALAVSDPFGFWMDHYGDKKLKDPEDDYDRFLSEQGLRVEKELLKSRHEVFEDLSGLGFSSALFQTEQLLKLGKTVIYDGAIQSLRLGLRARPDLLVVQRGRCEVEEYKLAGTPTEAYELQALVYAYILFRGYGLDSGTKIVTRLGESFPIAYDEVRVREAVRTAREILGRREAPYPVYNAPSRWSRLQNKAARESMDVTLAWNVGPAHSRRFHQMGIHSLEDLSRIDPGMLKTIKGLGMKKIPQIVNSVKAQLSRKPIRIGSFPAPGEGPENEIFLDLEGTGELFQDDPGWNCIYLIGLILRTRGKTTPYCSFLALKPGEEKDILVQFLEYLKNLNGAYRLYHWDHYERTQLRKACERHGIVEDFMQWIMPHLDDLCKNAQDSYVLPTPGYSIKVVAPYFGFQWTQSSQDVDAMKSAMIWYKQAIEGGNRGKLDRVLQYNEDDCRAMVIVKDGLEKLEKTRGETIAPV